MRWTLAWSFPRPQTWQAIFKSKDLSSVCSSCFGEFQQLIISRARWIFQFKDRRAGPHSTPVKGYREREAMWKLDKCESRFEPLALGPPSSATVCHGCGRKLSQAGSFSGGALWGEMSLLHSVSPPVPSRHIFFPLTLSIPALLPAPITLWVSGF